jgi:hypothetical protein
MLSQVGISLVLMQEATGPVTETFQVVLDMLIARIHSIINVVGFELTIFEAYML